MPEVCVFVNAFPLHFHQLRFVKTPSHCKNTFSLLLAWIEFVKTPSPHKILIGFPIKSFIINLCNCQLLCVSILREPISTKMSWNWPINCFLCDEAKAFVETTFPSLLAWLQFVKTPSRWSCHFFAMGRCFDELKMQVMLQKGLVKHLLIAKNSQKCPKIV